MSDLSDNIRLRNIRLPLALDIGPDAWHRLNKPQPAVISVRVSYPSVLVSRAADRDAVTQTLDYGKLYRSIEARIREEDGAVVADLAAIIARASFDLVRETLPAAAAMDFDYERIFSRWEVTREAEVWIHLPKAILRADRGLAYRALFGRGSPLSKSGERCVEHEFTIEGIRCYCILGVNPHEREEKQAVEVTLVFRFGEMKDDRHQCQKLLDCYQALTQQIAEKVDSSSFKTVEALANLVARTATQDFGMERVTARVEKPSAQAFVEYSGVEITRNARFFDL